MIQDIKKQMRLELLNKRNAFAIEQGIKSSKKIVKHLSDKFLTSENENKIFSLYYPIKNEVDIRSFMFDVYENKSIACLPVIKEKNQPLIFAKWSLETVLVKKTYNIFEPSIIEEVIPDVMIMPLLGFDKNGNRIGYGGGYYDMTINKLKKEGKKSLLIGAAFSVQELETIPYEKTDQRLDYIITEKKIFCLHNEDKFII